MNRAKDSDITDVNLPPLFAELVQKAVQLGWRATRAETGGSLILTSVHHPGRPQTIVIPLGEKTINQGTLRTWHQTMLRYADPTKVDKAVVGDGPVQAARIEAPIEAPVVPSEPKPEVSTPPVSTVKQQEDLEARTCTICDPPTVWPSPVAKAGHQRAHGKVKVPDEAPPPDTPNRRRIGALEQIIEIAQQVLGQTGNVAELTEDLAASERNMQDMLNALNRMRQEKAETEKELERVQAQLNEFKAAVSLFKGVIG